MSPYNKFFSSVLLSFFTVSLFYSLYQFNFPVFRVFTGTCLMLVGLSHSLTFTTLKQVPTLNRGFYVSGKLF